jgi:hypothetical protein
MDVFIDAVVGGTEKLRKQIQPGFQLFTLFHRRGRFLRTDSLPRIADSSSIKAVSFSSARTTKR